MASNINSTDIDPEFPIAGQDNDSQGFRDNFNTIKNSLATAKTEITDLQDTSAKLNATNDFNGNIISEAEFKANTQTVYSDDISGSQNVSFTNGSYQIFSVSGDLTLTFADWPATNKYAKIRLELKRSTGGPHTISFAASGGGTIKTDGNAAWTGDTISIPDDSDSTFVDFWTTDSGLVVFAQYVGKFS